jgi:putative DNA primase/helicase
VDLPKVPPFNVEKIPVELKRRRQWICWRYDMRDGKIIKVPVAPWMGHNAPVSVTDPNNCTDFNVAVDYARRLGLGVGFCFFEGAGIVGVDLDKLDQLGEEAQACIRKAESYCEYSPSGKGVHIYGYGELKRAIKKAGIEVYNNARFFTVTGNHVEGTPTTLGNIQPLLDEFVAKYGEKETVTVEVKPSQPTGGWENYVNKLGYTLREVREKDKVLDEYLRGGLTGKPSDSEADMGTLERLLFWGFEPNEAVAILEHYRWRKKLLRRDYIEGMLKKLLPPREIAKPKTPQTAEPPEKYFDDGKFVPKLLAEELMQEYHFITMRDNEQMYVWREGCYRPYAESLIKEECKIRLGEEFRTNRVNEVIDYIKASTFRDRYEEPPHLIPLQNGVLDINTMELKPHSPEYMFFNLLPVEYNPNAKCPNIEKFLSEITGCKEDVEILLEVIGIP